MTSDIIQWTQEPFSFRRYAALSDQMRSQGWQVELFAVEHDHCPQCGNKAVASVELQPTESDQTSRLFRICLGCTRTVEEIPQEKGRGYARRLSGRQHENFLKPYNNGYIPRPATCPLCEMIGGQIKIGFNECGSQRFKCKHCGRKYTPSKPED